MVASFTFFILLGCLPVLHHCSLLSIRFQNAKPHNLRRGTSFLKYSKHGVTIPEKNKVDNIIELHRLPTISLPSRCHTVVGKNDSQLLFDNKGHGYVFKQISKERDKKRYCRENSPRRRRQTDELLNRIKQANVEVTSVSSNVTISQLINITSGKSTVDIREEFLKININSDNSNVRIDPKESHVNISVIRPFVIVNASLMNSSDRDGFEMSTDESEIVVRTKRSDREAYIFMRSGKSNMTVRSGSAEVMASNADASNVTMQTSPGDNNPKMVITSNITRPDGVAGKVLGINLVARHTITDIVLISASVRIRYGKVDLRISEDDHTITIYTGIYSVRITAMTSPYTITIEKDVVVQVGESTVTIEPATSDIIGKITAASKMSIKPDKNASLSMSNGEEEGRIADNADSEIDVNSAELNFTIKPGESRITIDSLDTLALVTTNNVETGVQAEQSNIDILAGRPIIVVITGNTTIVIGPDIETGGNGQTGATQQPATGITGTTDKQCPTCPPISGTTQTPCPTCPLVSTKSTTKGATSPGKSTTKTPGKTTTKAPGKTTTKAPGKTTTKAPIKTTTKVPGKTTTKAPVKTTTKVPGKTTTKAPGKTTTKAPGKTTTKAPGKTTTKAPGKTTTKAPRKTTTKAPGKTTTKVPGKTTTKAPGKTTTKAPGKTTTKAPGKTTTKAPGKTTTKAPGKTTTKAPGKTTTKAPVKTTTKVPGKTTTKAPGKTTTKAPGKTTTKAPGKTTTKAPRKTTTKAPAKTTTKVPGKTTTKVPGKTTTKAPGKTTTKAPGKTTTKAPGKTTTKAPGKTTTKAPGKTTTKAPGKTTTKAPGKTTTKAPGKTTTKASGKSTTKAPGKTTMKGADHVGVAIESNIDGIQLPPIGLTVQDTVSTRTPTPAPEDEPAKRFKDIPTPPTLLPTELEFFADSAKLRQLDSPPPDHKFLLGVGLKSNETFEGYYGRFLGQVKRGLRNAYAYGQRAQLKHKRQRRQIFEFTETPKNDYPDLKLSGIDRSTPELIRLQFYLESHGDLIEAQRAKSIYDLITTEDLSSYLKYLVIEPIRPLITNEGLIQKSFSGFHWLMVFVIILSVSILIVIAIVFWKMKKNQHSDEVQPFTATENGLSRESNEKRHVGQRNWSNSTNHLPKNACLLGNLPDFKQEAVEQSVFDDETFQCSPSPPNMMTSEQILSNSFRQSHKVSPEITTASANHSSQAWPDHNSVHTNMYRLSAAPRRNRHHPQTTLHLLNAIFPLNKSESVQY